MFYYEPEQPAREPLSRTDLLLFVLLCAFWLVPGILGHEPWKPDEAYNFGLIRHMLQSGDWITLHLQDEPEFVRAPLYYWIATFFARTLSPVVPLHDAARLASAFFMTVSLTAIGLAGRELYGRGWTTILILMGSFGLVAHAHQMIADTALMAGVSLTLYALALTRKNPDLAGFIFACGAGIAFLSKGFLALWLTLPLVAIVPFLARKVPLRMVLLMTICLSPWVYFWPHALYNDSHALFTAWISSAFHIRSSEPLFFLAILPWFAWPTLPLALWTVWREKKSAIDKPELLLPLASFCLMLLLLTLLAPAREIHALPLLLPLSLLATASIDSLKRSLVSAFNWFGIFTFGLLAALLWSLWIAMMTGWPKTIAARIHHYHPDYVGAFHLLPFMLALLSTVLWLMLVANRGRDPIRASLNWACGIVMTWMILMTIWLPFLDSIKSYQEPFKALAAAVPARHGCIAGEGLGDAQRAMLDYYAGIRTERNQQSRCSLLIRQTLASNHQDPAGWTRIWEGARPGDRFERYRLYRKADGQ